MWTSNACLLFSILTPWLLIRLPWALTHFLKLVTKRRRVSLWVISLWTVVLRLLYSRLPVWDLFTDKICLSSQGRHSIRLIENKEHIIDTSNSLWPSEVIISHDCHGSSCSVPSVIHSRTDIGNLNMRLIMWLYSMSDYWRNTVVHLPTKD